MSIDIKNWSKHDSLVFNDQHFDSVNLHLAKRERGSDGIDFNTELTFNNCSIDTFNSATLFLGRKITFKNCQIGDLFCYATYFIGGFEMVDSAVARETSFSAGVHNAATCPFQISNSRFEGYADFFDVWFHGPVRIVNNRFVQGTNLGIYLKVPFGIAADLPCETSDNTGDLLKQQEGEPKIMRG